MSAGLIHSLSGSGPARLLRSRSARERSSPSGRRLAPPVGQLSASKLAAAAAWRAALGRLISISFPILALSSAASSRPLSRQAGRRLLKSGLLRRAKVTTAGRLEIARGVCRPADRSASGQLVGRPAGQPLVSSQSKGERQEVATLDGVVIIFHYYSRLVCI